MIIKNNWKSDNENESEENNSLIELSGLWSSQVTISISRPSMIKEGPVKKMIQGTGL